MKDEQLLRYSRQIMLPEIDISGQEKLLAAKVLIVGLGGLGCPAALYLAAAGVGELFLADHDKVDLTNLQRQIAHGVSDIGKYKAESVKASISEINPEIKVTCINSKLANDELRNAIAGVDAVVDCSDNFTTRFAINKYCKAEKKPLISGAAIRWEGQVAVYDLRHPESPCYCCLYEGGDDQNLSCSESGVLSPLVGVIASMQAIETLKLLLNAGEPLIGKLVILDVKTMEWRRLNLPKNRTCPVCGVE